MSAAFTVPAVFLFAYSGFVLLARSMDRHFRQLHPGRPMPAWPMRAGTRLAGWLLIALSWWVAVQLWGAGNGTAAWFGVASLMAGLLIWMLPWRPGWVTPFAAYGTLASLLWLSFGVAVLTPIS